MVEFNSIIVFDLETTSLPGYDGNTTKIIELAFLGCEVRHLKSAKQPPRALQKLVLLFKPNKKISDQAILLTGLDNELLQNVKPFRKEDAELLKNFIARLPSPTCIVAHNGEKFDFPILRKELFECDSLLGNEVYCADSIKAFMEIYPRKTAKKLKISNEKLKGENIEKTPPNQKTLPVNTLHYKGKISKVKKELFPDHDKLEQWLNEKDGPSCPSCPTNYNLQTVFEFLHEESFQDAHTAEGDSSALLSCIIKCQEFLNWISNHSVIFDTVPPLSPLK